MSRFGRLRWRLSRWIEPNESLKEPGVDPPRRMIIAYRLGWYKGYQVGNLDAERDGIGGDAGDD